MGCIFLRRRGTEDDHGYSFQFSCAVLLCEVGSRPPASLLPLQLRHLWKLFLNNLTILSSLSMQVIAPSINNSKSSGRGMMT
jgi:hypothetical protein